MLILTRRKDETIVIDGNIVVTVTGISGDRVRIAIDAPKQISIHRHEVQEVINTEKTEAKE